MVTIEMLHKCGHMAPVELSEARAADDSVLHRAITFTLTTLRCPDCAHEWWLNVKTHPQGIVGVLRAMRRR